MKYLKAAFTTLWSFAIIVLMFIAFDFSQNIADAVNDSELNTYLVFFIDIPVLIIGSVLICYPSYLTFRKSTIHFGGTTYQVK
jgi:hypothetical protein